MIRQFLRFLAYALPWFFARQLPSPDERGPTAPECRAGSTRMYPCKCGVEQRADGSWWLVFATGAGAGLPDATAITPQQATDIASQLRRTRSA